MSTQWSNELDDLLSDLDKKPTATNPTTKSQPSPVRIQSNTTSSNLSELDDLLAEIATSQPKTSSTTTTNNPQPIKATSVSVSNNNYSSSGPTVVPTAKLTTNSSSSSNSGSSNYLICCRCSNEIRDEAVQARSLPWHSSCLKCETCHKSLRGEKVY